MTDIVYNTMINFRFFCSDVFRHKNVDKLIPDGMSYSDWNARKEKILGEEIDNINVYLQREATARAEGVATADKEEVWQRFQEIIASSVGNYKEKIYNHHR